MAPLKVKATVPEREIDQRVMAFACKPEDLSLIPGNHIKMEREN